MIVPLVVRTVAVAVPVPDAVVSVVVGSAVVVGVLMVSLKGVLVVVVTEQLSGAGKKEPTGQIGGLQTKTPKTRSKTNSSHSTEA